MSETKTIQELRQSYSREQIFEGLDSATQLGLEKHFWYRHACDSDEKFLFFLHRNIEEIRREYNKYLDLQTMEVDPLIVNLKNRTKELTGANSLTITDNGTVAHTIEVLNNLQKAETSSLHGQKTSSGDITEDSTFSNQNGNTRTNNLQSTHEANSKGRNLHSDTPQANVSPNTSSDLDAQILWNYASDIEDNYTSENSEDADTGTVTDAGTESGTGRNVSETSGASETTQSASKTINDTGTKTTTESKTNNDSKTHTGSNSGSEEVEESGRSGHLVSEILGEWRKYITKTDAFLWLCDELEKCFMSNLLYGEDDEDEETNSSNERIMTLWNYKTS